MSEPNPSDDDPTGQCQGPTDRLPESWNAWPRHLPEVDQALHEIMATGHWGRYHGPETDRLAEELGTYFQRPCVYLCNSGTVGIELALRGVGIQTDDEVILAAYDFPGNFRAIETIGARPVLVDLCPGGWTLDPDQLDAAFGPHTKAIIVSHLHGDTAPMPGICRWAEANGVAVVEDACQSPGGRIDGRPIGTWGDVSVLSFGGSKLLTAGRGGAVLTSNPQIHQRIRVFSGRGNDAFALSQIQASILRPQLPRLDEDTARRDFSAQLLVSELASVRCLSRIKAHRTIDANTRPRKNRGQTDADNRPAYYKLAWSFSAEPCSREALVREMRSSGIPMDVGFRGFTLRSSRRCRTIGPLDSSRRAAAQTVLLHHPILLRDTVAIRRLAAAMTHTLHRLGLDPTD